MARTVDANPWRETPLSMKQLIPLLSLFLIACHSAPKSESKVIYVSIAPLKYVVEQIADSTARSEVLVPETSSPESFEPTIQQVRDLANASMYITTGLLDFERALAAKIPEIAPQTAIVNLSEGIDVLEGSCSHNHGTDDAHGGHGVDPHIWLSPRLVAGMGQAIAARLGSLHPQSASVYDNRAKLLAQRIDSLDNHIQQQLSQAKRRSFAIGHTSLSYFAQDYGLEQIAVEVDGKEPSVKAMKALIDTLQGRGVRTVLYQLQTSDAAARTIARELPGGRAVVFDPMSEAWLENMYRLADTLQVILNE